MDWNPIVIQIYWKIFVKKTKLKKLKESKNFNQNLEYHYFLGFIDGLREARGLFSKEIKSSPIQNLIYAFAILLGMLISKVFF